MEWWSPAIRRKVRAKILVPSTSLNLEARFELRSSKRPSYCRTAVFMTGMASKLSSGPLRNTTFN